MRTYRNVDDAHDDDDDDYVGAGGMYGIVDIHTQCDRGCLHLLLLGVTVAGALAAIDKRTSSQWSRKEKKE